MGAATRPAGPRQSRGNSNRPVWLVVAAVCFIAAGVYLCLSIAGAIRSEPALHSEVGVAPALAAEEVPATASASEPLPAATVATAPAVLPTIAAPRPATTPSVATGAVARPNASDEELLRTIEDAIGEAGEHIAVSVKRISDGRFAEVNGDRPYYAASLFKLAVLYEAERRHFTGELSYDDRVIVSEEDFTQDLGTSGALDFEDDGSISIGAMLRAMITISDNVSAVALMHVFGSGSIDRTLRGLGIETMTVTTEELWTTANDEARLMEAIYTGEGVGEIERAHMRELLRAQTIRNGIPAALADERRDGLVIGNKTGTWEGARHDVAFIEAQAGAYVLSVLTDGSYEGWEALGRVAKNVQISMISP